MLEPESATPAKTMATAIKSMSSIESASGSTKADNDGVRKSMQYIFNFK